MTYIKKSLRTYQFLLRHLMVNVHKVVSEPRTTGEIPRLFVRAPTIPPKGAPTTVLSSGRGEIFNMILRVSLRF